jgi:hypothetical protein
MNRAFTPETAEDLYRITTPGFVDGGNMEMYRSTLKDTALVNTGDTAARYFDQPRAVAGATNLDAPGAGQLPQPKYFQIGTIHATSPVGAVTVDVPEAWEIATEIFLRHNARLTLVIEEKQYGPWSLWEASALGGLTGFGYGTPATPNLANEYANNGRLGLGVNIAGTLWLTPKTSFRAVIDWPAGALALPDGIDDVPLALEFVGATYRAIR